MKIVLYIIIIVGSLLIPLEKADIAKLQPVEAVVLRENNGATEIYTDTGAWGSGENAQKALSDLINNTPGIVYLDTAKYLMVTQETLFQIESIRDELKGSVRLCLWNCEGNLKDAVKYFEVYDELPKLRNWKQGDNLPEYISKKQ